MSEVDLIVDMIEGDLIVEVAAMMIAGVDLDTTEIGGMIEAHLDTIETGEMIEDPPPDMTEIGVMTEDMTETGEMMVNLVKTKKAAVVMKIALLTVDVTVETVVRIRMG